MKSPFQPKADGAAQEAPRITDCHFTSIHAPHDQGGLLGFIALTLGGTWRLDGIALRRSAAGTIILSFPERRDGQGRRHPVVRPLDAVSRAAIEAQIFALLGLPVAADVAPPSPTN